MYENEAHIHKDEKIDSQDIPQEIEGALEEPKSSSQENMAVYDQRYLEDCQPSNIILASTSAQNEGETELNTCLVSLPESTTFSSLPDGHQNPNQAQEQSQNSEESIDQKQNHYSFPLQMIKSSARPNNTETSLFPVIPAEDEQNNKASDEEVFCLGDVSSEQQQEQEQEEEEDRFLYESDSNTSSQLESSESDDELPDDYEEPCGLEGQSLVPLNFRPRSIKSNTTWKKNRQFLDNYKAAQQKMIDYEIKIKQNVLTNPDIAMAVDLQVMKSLEYQHMLSNVNKSYLDYLDKKGGKLKDNVHKNEPQTETETYENQTKSVLFLPTVRLKSFKAEQQVQFMKEKQQIEEDLNKIQKGSITNIPRYIIGTKMNEQPSNERVLNDPLTLKVELKRQNSSESNGKTFSLRRMEQISEGITTRLKEIHAKSNDRLSDISETKAARIEAMFEENNARFQARRNNNQELQETVQQRENGMTKEFNYLDDNIIFRPIQSQENIQNENQEGVQYQERKQNGNEEQEEELRASTNEQLTNYYENLIYGQTQKINQQLESTLNYGESNTKIIIEKKDEQDEVVDPPPCFPFWERSRLSARSPLMPYGQFGSQK